MKQVESVYRGRSGFDFPLRRERGRGIRAAQRVLVLANETAWPPAVLLDRRSGREIWNVTVQGTDRLTPTIRGGSLGGTVGGAIVTAGTLRTMTVADFQQALDQLMSLSSDVVAEELRAALREARR